MLRHVILSVLKDGPRHGYEIIKHIEERTHGLHSPSPGALYPTLQYLEDLGLVRSEQQGDKRVYHLTDSGRIELDKQHSTVEGFWSRFSEDMPPGASMHELRFAGDAVKDLLSGRVQVMFDAGTSAIANAKTGKLRMIGVVGEKRPPFTPDVPTLTEQGIKGIDLVGWLGWFGPANLPADIQKKYNEAFVKALAHPDVKAAIEKGGYESISSTPEQLSAMVKRDIERWGKIIRDIGFKPQ